MQIQLYKLFYSKVLVQEKKCRNLLNPLQTNIKQKDKLKKNCHAMMNKCVENYYEKVKVAKKFLIVSWLLKYS